MSHQDIENKFNQAVEYVTNNSSKLSNLKNEEQLYLYCNFKQATIGDCNTKQPPFYDYIGKTKWNSWNSLKGVDKIVAMNSYISLVNKIAPGWDSNIGAKQAESQSIFLEDEEFNEQERVQKEEYAQLKQEGREEEKSKSKSKWMGPVVSKFSMVDDETLEKLSKEEQVQDLSFWISENNLNKFKEELEKDKSKINEKDKEGRTPLTYACDRGIYEIVKILVENGADINHQDSEGMTPLHYSTLCNHVEICKFLLTQEKINRSLKDNSDSTPLDLADSDEIKSLF
ncbi:hypothetical protein DICPUDRAFT_155651 [Dictyostelium purpureum]|uniref:ACB domain-containing protein n=1 Tax=Dictyostelium purpureum TaxID=5786 RepID=F0ZUK1_DICPU|nr:uncharacterized protein DICPUDRAFT_155651 [Dictyostelium purpureum]EGC32373.1 hypothetical protein DICPUDRAFT_155651 [Dictyostelium purpureum]|eukprot:XP_003291103.1 hypothetical protein DICPUDRAFT_155651 [Dictyostelium purpureum]